LRGSGGPFGSGRYITSDAPLQEDTVPMPMLSDKGLSIFTFAAYHALNSGEHVSEVTLRDQAGHAADPQGVREVTELGLATVNGDMAVFTEEGKRFLDGLLQQIRGTAKTAERATAVA
jgi:hypothetical protein